MSKVKVSFVLSMIVLFAAMAVFSGVVQGPFFSAGKSNLPAVQHNSVGTLTADGGDPQPKPMPFPWRMAA
jgi:hypothetical protein